MTDPRAAVAFEGIGQEILTFKIDASTITYSVTEVNGSAAVGLAVKLASADTIALTTDGSGVLGKLLKVDPDGFASVQVEGGMKLPGGNNATLTVLKKIVGA